MILEHRQAIKALLADLPVTFYGDGKVPDTPSFPYAVLFMDTGTEDATKVVNDSDRAVFRPQVTSVGLTDDAAAIVADLVRSRLLDVRPVVAGRKTTRLKRYVSLPVRTDTGVTDPATGLQPSIAQDTYRFESFPA